MKAVLLQTVLILLLSPVVCAWTGPGIPVPSPRQLKWHEAEMGAVFHYDLHVFDGKVYG